VDDIRVTHIGGPTVLVEVAGWTILSDPTFDPPGRTYPFALGTSSTKLVGPAIEAASLPAVDLVLLSHDHHADNLDDAGRALLPTAGAVLTTVPGAQRLGRSRDLRDLEGLRPWETTHLSRDGLPNLEVTATPCRHGPLLSRPIVGSVVGFVLRWDGASAGSLWFSGDTVLYGGVVAVAGRFDIDVAFVHMGDVKFGLTGPVHYSLTADEGVSLVAAVRPRIAVPVHYEGWSHFRQGRAEIERAVSAASADVRSRIRFVEIGEPTVLTR
jgi:L-ascorbate metabolism protein UlaG (beta-lactamase superfamily)